MRAAWMEPAGQPCGYFGKLPARADFVGHGLSHRATECWDAWLRQGLAASQRGLEAAEWERIFLSAPAWHFVLPQGSCAADTLIGVMVPSRDTVGRCFPLMLGQEVPGAQDPVALMVGSARWFAAAEVLATEVLGPQAQPALLRRPLPPPGLGPRPPAAPFVPPGLARPVGRWASLPLLAAAPALLGGLWQPGREPAPAVWWSAGAPHIPPCLATTPGLVAAAGFAALLDGAWERHGWTRADGLASGFAADAADWDREA